MMSKTIISVIMPVRNEAGHIERTLASLCGQVTSDFDLEFLVVDGRSIDGSREIIERQAAADSRITLLDNPRQTTPVAFNLGLQAARGEYVCILGAHAEYPPDYIAICFHELLARDVTACSGRIATVPSSPSISACLSAWCLKHRFASGNSVRTSRGGFVDTVPFPVIRKTPLLEAGGYDEELSRNQDNDMNQRLVALGHKMYLTPRTEARYFARPTVASLLRYSYNTGLWNARTVTRNVSSMALRHFVPFAFVTALAGLGLAYATAIVTNTPTKLPLIGLAVALGSHLLMGLVAGIETMYREHRLTGLLLPFVILMFHLAYGIGTIAGFAISPISGPRLVVTQTGADVISK